MSDACWVIAIIATIVLYLIFLGFLERWDRDR
jgi:hypothetical protein